MLIVPSMYCDIVLFMGLITIVTAIRKQCTFPKPGYQVAMPGKVKPRPDIK